MLRGVIIAAVLACATAAAGAALHVGLTTVEAAAAAREQALQREQAVANMAWAEAAPPAGTNTAELEAAMNDVFAPTHDAVIGETRAVIVVVGGRIVAERYNEGYSRDTRLISWSMAKSITQGLVGAAVQQGRVDIDTPLGNPHWAADDPRQQITWRNFLNMTDGLAWNEIDAADVTENDSARMLFGPGRLDTAAYAAGQPVVGAVDAHWNYNSGGSVLLGDALTRVIVPDPQDAADRRNRMRAWMDSALFDVIGMDPIVQFDAQGTYHGSSQIYATARDFARFGQLYLQDGVWNGTRVLPEGWVDFARAHGPAANTDTYGAHWWLTPTEGEGKPYRSLITDLSLSDAYSAQGHEGQVILVVPSKNLVMVRLGMFENGREHWNALGDWMQRVVLTFPDAPSS